MADTDFKDNLQDMLEQLEDGNKLIYDAALESRLTDMDIRCLEDENDIDSFVILQIRIQNDIGLWRVPAWYRAYFLGQRRQEIIEEYNLNRGLYPADNNDNNENNNNNINNNNTTDRKLLFKFFSEHQAFETIKA
eukprot:67065_1